MSYFLYPKLIHRRKEEPPAYKDYRSYKPALQREFSRTCIYCQAVDTVTRGINFGIDHYRPKSKFPEETTNYKNLFYCCSSCNTRKSNHWPFPEFEDKQMIPNPCAHVMTKHLRFRGAEVVSQSECGEFTLALLDLNAPDVLEFREHVNHMIDLLVKQYDEAITSLEKLKNLEIQLRVSSDDAAEMHEVLKDQISQIENSLSLYYGTKPVP